MNDIYQQLKLKNAANFTSLCSKKDLDNPPFSRLFVLYPKVANMHELQQAFEQYGPIEDIWIVKDKDTLTTKGIAYIKYSKTSHAAKAIEELNGKCLNGYQKALKVIVSNSKNDTKANIANETTDSDRMLRLFVVIPKDFKKKDLRDSFKQFGEIENVQIIFNKSTNENKGFGYVRFYKASDAARALEECDPIFKPKFAEPYSVKLAREREINVARDMMATSSNSSPTNLTLTDSSTSSSFYYDEQRTTNLLTSSINQLTNETKLLVKCFTSVDGFFLHRLFDLIPGLIDFSPLPDQTLALIRNEAFYVATYESKEMASHAQRKLNNFPGPCGETINIYDLDTLINQTRFN